jgi:hypothetical protein
MANLYVRFYVVFSTSRVISAPSMGSEFVAPHLVSTRYGKLDTITLFEKAIFVG